MVAAPMWPPMRRRAMVTRRPAAVATVEACCRERVLAGLTTHVLDVTRGGPAEAMRVELYELAPDGARRPVADVTTNSDGRTNKPLIAAAEARIGQFELVFHVGDYFRAQQAKLADPPFLDIVPIRFAVADVASHYHVPLLVSPWSYSTYRGS
jgi:5-hydroxyisourate hydrolase